MSERKKKTTTAAEPQTGKQSDPATAADLIAWALAGGAVEIESPRGKGLRVGECVTGEYTACDTYTGTSPTGESREVPVWTIGTRRLMGGVVLAGLMSRVTIGERVAVVRMEDVTSAAGRRVGQYRVFVLPAP